MRLVDTATAAIAYGVNQRTIRRWVATGQLLNHGTPRRLLVDLDTPEHGPAPEPPTDVR